MPVFWSEQRDDSSSPTHHVVAIPVTVSTEVTDAGDATEGSEVPGPILQSAATSEKRHMLLQLSGASLWYSGGHLVSQLLADLLEISLGRVVGQLELVNLIGPAELAECCGTWSSCIRRCSSAPLNGQSSIALTRT
eukprot:TRINITY_DN10690_c0_g1_i1.p1 TRINITY_DN10690_c0_g1~~TRINITY_DN10690_c0_g1_i1.p1  ORF type:complete len:148 (-),score=17.86 TRINITY_DN10690_c0_g1_i1:38-445(-)